jgi:PEP-CTERM motif
MKKTLIVSLAFVPMLASAGNLLTNGSFENGLNGWTHASSNLASPVAAIDDGSTADYPVSAFGESIPTDNAAQRGTYDAVGTHAAYFSDDFADNETLSQQIHVVAGTDYTFGFDAYVPGNGFANPGDATLVATVGGDAFATLDVGAGPVQGWTHYEASGTASSTGTIDFVLTFNANYAPSKDVVVDDVYFAPAVPEPEAWALMIAGLGLVGSMAFRRPR